MKKPNFMNTEWWSNYGSGILMTGCALVVFVAFLITNTFWDRNLEKAESEALVQQNERLAEQSREEQVQAVSSTESKVRQAVNGLDPQRKVDDDKLAADVFSHALTWSNSEEYAQSREKLLKKYPWLDESSPFLS